MPAAGLLVSETPESMRTCPGEMMRYAACPTALIGALVLGLPMAGQSLRDLLKSLPASTLSVEVYPRPSELDRKGLAVGKRFDATGSWVGLKAKTGLDVAKLTGPLVLGELPGQENQGAQVVLAPMKNPLATLAQLNAKAIGKAWTFTVAQPKKGEQTPRRAQPRVWYAMPKGSVLQLASDLQTLQEIQSGKSSLAPELASLGAILQARDTTLVVTERGAVKWLKTFSEGMEKGIAPGAPMPGVNEANRAMARAMAEGLETWVAKADASVRHLVLSLDISERGDLHIQGNATFKEGSPLHRDFAALPAMPLHPLGALPAGGFAVASGGQWPTSFGSLAQWLIKSMDVPGSPVTPELREKWAKASEAVSKPIQSFHYALDAPAKPGDALLSQLMVLMQVENGAAYRDASLEAAQVQGEWMKALGQGMTVTTQKDILPGIPSWTVTMDFAGLAGDKVPPAQLKMFTDLIFGGNAMRFSYGESTPGTVVGVPGGATELENAIRRVKTGPAIAATPSLMLTDRMLPKGSRFAFYLSPKGLRDMAQVLTKSFMGPGAPSLPELPEGEPAGFSITLEGKEAGFHIVVPAGSLDASAKLVKAMNQHFKGKTGVATQPRGKAPK